MPRTKPEAGKPLYPKAKAKRKTAQTPGSDAKASNADRRPDGTFRKGQSGNPTGRPKGDSEVRDLARQHTERAIERLAEIMEQSADLSAAARASNALLDRGWGKAPQSMELTGKDGKPLVPVLKILHTDGSRSGSQS